VIGYERQKSVIIEKVEDNFKLVTFFRKFEVNFKYQNISPQKPKKPIAPQAHLLYSKQEYFMKITKNN